MQRCSFPKRFAKSTKVCSCSLQPQFDTAHSKIATSNKFVHTSSNPDLVKTWPRQKKKRLHSSPFFLQITICFCQQESNLCRFLDARHVAYRRIFSGCGKSPGKPVQDEPSKEEGNSKLSLAKVHLVRYWSYSYLLFFPLSRQNIVSAHSCSSSS